MKYTRGTSETLQNAKTAECQEAFDILKKRPSSPLIFTFSVLRRILFTLDTEGSNQVIGVVLSQAVNSEEKDNEILSKAERTYNLLCKRARTSDNFQGVKEFLQAFVWTVILDAD